MGGNGKGGADRITADSSPAVCISKTLKGFTHEQVP